MTLDDMDESAEKVEASPPPPPPDPTIDAVDAEIRATLGHLDPEVISMWLRRIH